MASTLLGVFGALDGEQKPNLAGASKFVGVGIGNGTLKALQINKALLQANIIVPEAKGSNIAAENLEEGISTSLVGSLNLKALLPGLSVVAPAVKALAQGVGNGVVAGLKLKALSSSIISPFDTRGLNGISGGFGEGLAYSFFDGIDTKKLMADLNVSPTGPQANLIGLSFAKGFGGSASYALNLTSKSTSDWQSASGYVGVAGNVGSGLASSFLGGVPVQKLQTLFATNFSTSQTNDAALSLAKGLGSGAAFALKLSTVLPNASTTNGISGIASNVGVGLTTSFLQNVNLTDITSKVTDSLSGTNLLAVAYGLGSGFGAGGAVAFGLQLADQNVTSDIDVKAVARILAKGTAESFLSNITPNKITQGLLGVQFGAFDVSKAATGLGVEIVAGAQQGLENAGGVVGLRNISSTNSIGMMRISVSSTYDDGVQGIASGFGSGLGFEGTKVLLQVLGKPALNTNATAMKKKVESSRIGHRSIDMYKQEASSPAKLDSLMLAKTLDPILQAGSNSIGCQGVGGLAAVFHSLGGSKALGDGRLANLTMALGSFTNEMFTVKDNAGNTFTINVAENLITVNGMTITKLFNFTAMHK